MVHYQLGSINLMFHTSFYVSLLNQRSGDEKVKVAIKLNTQKPMIKIRYRAESWLLRVQYLELTRPDFLELKLIW